MSDVARLRSARALRLAHDRWLFECAYPPSRQAWARADAGLRALARRVRELGDAGRARALFNSGIAGSTVGSAFSLAITRWLLERFPGDVRLLSVGADKPQAMALLGTALDPLEREALGEHPLAWARWQRQHLGEDSSRRLERLLQLALALPSDAALREAAFVAQRVFVEWRIGPDAPSLTLGRWALCPLRPQPDGPRPPGDLADAWGRVRPRERALDDAGRAALVDLARGVMASLLRETDFFSFANVGETRLFDLGRGLQAALFACAPAHKLALECYVGYLLIRNRIPVAYGGAWVLGRQARFGVNVLPPFRGGESQAMVAALLRLYAWRFRVRRIVVDPYQIGHGNPDGIASGAFWFYHRLGFRPQEPALGALADAWLARRRRTGERTPAAVLRTLSASTLAWDSPGSGRRGTVDIRALGAAVSGHVLARFDGDRDAARRAALARLAAADPRAGDARRPGANALARLAVLFAAIEPRRGWSAGEVAALVDLADAKDVDEERFARLVAAHAGLMRALDRAGTPREAGRAGTPREAGR
ncbi:MAG: hypothetical protein U1E86_25155 [Burkholderiaceae bacterium]